jgi:hypothetical protein
VHGHLQIFDIKATVPVTVKFIGIKLVQDKGIVNFDGIYIMYTGRKLSEISGIRVYFHNTRFGKSTNTSTGIVV